MFRRVLLCMAAVLVLAGAAGKEREPGFLALRSGHGTLFRTNDFVRGGLAVPYYGSLTLKYASAASGRSWEDIAYGMPYYGFGVYAADLGRGEDLGTPVSLFVFSGATISRYSRRLALNCEWDLGMSMGWKPYDAFTNPDNVAIGSPVNIHISLDLYLKWYVSKRIDMNFGVGVTHFSNGASRLPNGGINAGDVFAEMSYYFNRPGRTDNYDVKLTAPSARRHVEYDILVNISQRQVRMDTVGTGLLSEYVSNKFNVFGLSGAVLYAPDFKYRYGAGVDLLYDESSGSYMMREPLHGVMVDRLYYGSFGRRFSVGVSAKGEMVMPRYSLFANIGCQLLHGNCRDRRLYQIMGIKIYLKDNFFGTFGIRATRFSKAQYLYWSLGYTLGKDR